MQPSKGHSPIRSYTMADSTDKKPGFFRSAIMNWLGVPIDLTNGDFWRGWASYSNPSDQPVNYNTVMSLSTFVACVRLIAETISTLPLVLYKRQPNGSKTVAYDHPLYTALAITPNSSTVAAVHWEAFVAAMLMRGYGRAEKLRFNGRVVGMQFLAPEKLVVSDNVDGTYTYSYFDRDNTQRDIPADDIFGVPGFSLNGVDGLSVIQYGAAVFGSALAADTAAGSTFKNGLMPTSYIKWDRALTEEQREKFRADGFRGIVGAMNAGNSFVLERDQSVGSVGISPDDAQLLESRKWSTEEICRLMRVPPWLVGHTSSGATTWGSGMEQQLLGFLTFTLKPWLTRIEQSVSSFLLTPQEKTQYTVKYDLNDFLRADSATRANFLSTMKNSGIMTTNECREREDFGPYQGENGDKLIVQGANVFIDNLGANNGSPVENNQ